MWKSGSLLGMCGITRATYFQPSSCIALIYQSTRSCTIADRLQYEWAAEKNLDGNFIHVAAKKLLGIRFHVQVIFWDSIVLQSSCYRTTENWLQYKSNTTGRLKIGNMDGSPIVDHVPFSILVSLLSRHSLKTKLHSSCYFMHSNHCVLGTQSI